jgi:hypothetical protein
LIVKAILQHLQGPGISEKLEADPFSYLTFAPLAVKQFDIQLPAVRELIKRLASNIFSLFTMRIYYEQSRLSRHPNGMQLEH